MLYFLNTCYNKRDQRRIYTIDSFFSFFFGQVIYTIDSIHIPFFLFSFFENIFLSIMTKRILNRYVIIEDCLYSTRGFVIDQIF